MVGVEEGREFRLRGDLYSQESTFPLVYTCVDFAFLFIYPPSLFLPSVLDTVGWAAGRASSL